MPSSSDEETFRTLIEHSLDVIALVDPEGVVSYVSPSVARVLGYRPEEFVALGAFEIVHPDDRDRAVQRLAAIVRQPGGSQAVLNRVRHKDGSWRWIETVSTNQLENPSVRAIVASFRDITDRRRMEEALREREEHFRLIVASAIDFAIFTLGLDGRIMSWNIGAERILGYHEGEILGKHVSVIFTAEDNARGRAEFEMRGALYEGHENDDRWHVKKGGGRIWANGMMMPLKDEAGEIRGYLKILRDRTEQKRARDSLKLSEERHRLAADAARLGLWHCDLPSGTTSCDERCQEHLGLSQGVAAGFEALQERLHPDDRARVRADVERAVGEHQPFDSEWRILAPDGRVRWIQAIGHGFYDDSGVPYRFDGVTIDVSDRKRAEESLRESEKRFRSLADTTPVVIWMTDVDGSAVYFNTSWLELTGRAMGRELGDGWLEGLHPEDRARCLDVHRAAFEARRPFDVEYRLRGRDGEYRWVFLQGRPLLTPGGEFTGFIGSGIDIHDRKLAEQALRDADRRKDEFLAMLAHELRNPLAAINHAVQVSLRPAGGDDLEWSQGVIERQSRHLARLLDDLLDVSRITHGKIELRKERIDASPIIDGAVEAVRPLIEESRQELAVAFTPGTLWCEVDPTRLEQVLINLLTNATRYTPPGGRIRLTAAREGGHVTFKVKDTGIGIPPGKLSEMFELFTQGDRTIARSEGGLGIGLTIVRRLAELHGGTAAAFSDGPGEGSEFTVTLPAIPRPTPAPDATPPIGPGRGRPARILIADDNLDTARGLARLLKRPGNDVHTAHDGPAALSEALALRPEFILLDIGLPGMDGYQVARQIRRAGFEDAVIIAISGYGQDEDRRRSREAGFDHHLVKPVDYDALIALIGRPSS